MSLSVAALLGPLEPAFGVDNFGWAGGRNYYANRGMSVQIETQSPYAPLPGYVSAYGLTGLAGYQQYIQIGWSKDLEWSGQPSYFWEWRNCFTGAFNQKYFGSPAVGTVHTYQLDTGSTAWYFRIDGVGLTSMPVTNLTYWPNEIQFYGETSDFYHDRYPGSLSNHCSFYSGAYKNPDGVWCNAYYYPTTYTYGATTAGGSSTGFDIWDTRP